jgi:hypothetical protein
MSATVIAESAGLDQVDVGGDESAQPAQVSRGAGKKVGGL